MLNINIRINKALVASFVYVLFLGTSNTSAAVNSCVDCHSQIHEQITNEFNDDIHNKHGLTCVSCHGGNSAIEDEKSMDPKFGFVGAPKAKDIPKFCARCHSDPAYMRPYNSALPVDQLDKYWTSRHGELLQKGDSKVATCVSCHKTHSILPAKDSRSSVHPMKVPETCAKCHSNSDYMAKYDIPVNQYEQYTDTLNVHGYALLIKGDLGAPACNDCHGNHGAAPPGVSQVSQVCNQCHTLNGELFRNSPHKDGFDALGIMECAFCHQLNPDMNNPKARIHTIAKPNRELVGSNGVCVQCHSSGEDGFDMAQSVSMLLDSLENRLNIAENMLAKAEQQGHEVSDARWKLKTDVLQARMELRTAIHAFNLDTYKSAHTKADTSLNEVLLAAISAEKETLSRRIYFLIITILLGLFIIGLVLKIKQIEKERR